MLDVGWICGEAIRAVYWLVMLVCNFLGYSTLWAQIGLKKRTMDNIRIKIPNHLAVVFTEKNVIRTDEIMELISSCLKLEIRQLSLYDPFGLLASKESEFEMLAKLMNVSTYIDGELVIDRQLSNMEVHVLSRKSGKCALVEVCKTLCRKSDKINVDDISKTLLENYRLSDPEFLIQVGKVPSFCGYPPFNLRITEFIQSPRLPCSKRALDGCIESFSQRDIRVGK